MSEADPANTVLTRDQRAIYPSLKGKRVLITGGGSGIGAGLVEGFVRQGADVTFFDIADADSQALVGNLSGLGKAPTYENVDLTDIKGAKATIARLIEEHGAFDVLINNAANDDRHTIEEVTEDYWENRLNVNLRHLFFCAQAVIPGMKAKGGGVIINMGSISWHLALEGLILYQTAKAGIEGLTRSLARDLGPDNIRSVCIVPGNVKTPRQMKWYTPEGEAEIVNAQCLKGRLVPDDIAAMALFLASDDARLITSHEFFVDAGWR
ncbi:MULTISPECIES: SDR family NAD(P)-dependent oxidoreductase [Sphingomonas]|uniref:NAD(P)-dependent dehydrogenase (Short-subunit alcohol dehydrogenase family) n=1 Tax=Sphingomonas kyeonggiensis TaxID=1268553 RepID=A0A7W7NTW3_9SPHN|nr:MULTISPECIES: SDR family oxidoreductase [Sphingomonas]MBB4840169.1 NAD(P)-dependent dehydrogenase (short-subunit alcohol dehydrogenase family) [Sphingomonas kyeonggiensis]WHU04798.1 SDR family oxidoreductase [Sphingomonas sp. NIBR02145]